jgi:hypothetical protein
MIRNPALEKEAFKFLSTSITQISFEFRRIHLAEPGSVSEGFNRPIQDHQIPIPATTENIFSRMSV